MKPFLLIVLFFGITLNAQTFTVTNLPIVKIITPGNAAIPNEPKMNATMQIIYNGPGVNNNVTDPANHYNGNIGIETRGSSSSGFPKKGYGLETRDALNNSVAVSLLGMPAESDWILRAMYTDKSDMNDMLAYNLARKQGRYGPRTRYVEVMLNGNYQGIYIFEEKIKRDSLRVGIAKLKPADTAGVNLTGGYILKIDKPTGSATSTGWTSNYKVANCGSGCNFYTKFQHDYPDESVMHAKQKTYIRQYVDSFETALYGANYRDPINGYRKFATASTFIDYMLINELSKNVDGYRISTYFYKPKNEKLKMGPVWDYDITFGNANYCQGSDTSGWAYNFNYVCGAGSLSVPAWWERFNSDTNYKNQTKCQYTQYRQNIFSKSALYAVIDSAVLVLRTNVSGSNPVKRDSTKWNIIGNYVWPNPTPVPTSYNGEILELKNWLSKRINWLDANMPGTCIQPTVALVVSNNINKCIGDSLVLQVNGTGPFPEFDWYKNGVKIAGATNAKFKIPVTVLTDAGTYTCRVKNLYNQEIISAPITVNINPYPVISIAGSNSACIGSPATITASGATSYVWSTGQTSNSISPIINATTTVSVQGTSLGCTTTGSKTISVLPLPTVSITATSPNVCSGDSTVLTASGANTYTWSNGANGTSTSVNLVTATTYTATGIDVNGCINNASISIGIIPPPTITITSNAASVCIGDTAILTASGANNFIWDNGQTGPILKVSPSVAAVYSVTGTNASGCIGSNSKAINILPLPTVTAYSSSGSTCPGVGVLIFANGANTYTWSSGQTASFVSVNPQITTNYIVTGTAANGCKGSFTYTHIVKPKPQISISVSDSVACENEQVILTASGAGTYTWNTGNSGPVLIVNPTQNVTYTATGIANGCSGSKSKMIVVNPNPNVTFALTNNTVCVGNNSIPLSGGIPIGGVYSGLNVANSNFSALGLNPSLYPITYTYTDANGCSAAQMDNVIVNACLGLANMQKKAEVVGIFPNPFNNELTVEKSSNKNLHLEIYNNLGQIIFKSELLDVRTRITVSEFSAGQYFVILKDELGIVYHKKIIKE
jgi:CotH kinase protein/Secretion system C-terminal sorting domain